MRAQLDDPLGDAGQQRQIAADVRLHVQARDLRAEQQAPDVARHAEVDQPRLDDRIDDDHFPAAPPHVHQRRHQPRMIAGRVAADDEDQSACSRSSSSIVAVPLPVTLVSPTPLA